MELLLDSVVEEGGEVRSLYFSGSVPPYKPGNFFRLWLQGNDGKRIFRPYSAASHPSEPGLRLSIKKHTSASLAAEGASASSAPIKKNGSFSDMVFCLKQGDRVEVDGPYGIFTLGQNDGERVFIAGGVGITPLRGMIIQTLMEGKPAVLFHSSRTLEGITCIGEMKLLELQSQGFKYFPAVTRELMPEGWGGMTGRVGTEEIRGKLGTLSGKTFYICGPPEMVEGVVKGLLDAGVKKESIRKEEWG